MNNKEGLFVFRDNELMILSLVLLKNNILHRVSIDEIEGEKAYTLWPKDELTEKQLALIWAQYDVELDQAYPKE
jgi:hypothetical protein